MKDKITPIALKILLHYYLHCYSYTAITVAEISATQYLVDKSLIAHTGPFTSMITDKGKAIIVSCCEYITKESA